MATDLKCCPFCGCVGPLVVEVPDSSKASGLIAWITCRACGSRGTRCSRKREAVAGWNERHEPIASPVKALE